MPFDLYPPEKLPPLFRYPDQFVQTAATMAPNHFYPWWFIQASTTAGQLSFELRQSDGRNLIPFAKTDEFDDIACFDGDDPSGNPRILIKSSTPDRVYGYSDFKEWLMVATRDAAALGPVSFASPLTERQLCKVIGVFDPESVQVSTTGLDSTRVPIAAVPPDLRLPNAGFWLLRHGDSFTVFRQPQDAEPAATASWSHDVA